jgi:osmotically-inducible protein OsmY
VVAEDTCTSGNKEQPIPTSASVKQAVADALHRDAAIDAASIDVVCDGEDVWLSGAVQSWAAFCHAERAAQATEGVGVVHNDVRIHVPQLSVQP